MNPTRLFLRLVATLGLLSTNFAATDEQQHHNLPNLVRVTAASQPQPSSGENDDFATTTATNENKKAILQTSLLFSNNNNNRTQQLSTHHHYHQHHQQKNISSSSSSSSSRSGRRQLLITDTDALKAAEGDTQKSGLAEYLAELHQMPGESRSGYEVRSRAYTDLMAQVRGERLTVQSDTVEQGYTIADLTYYARMLNAMYERKALWPNMPITTFEEEVRLTIGAVEIDFLFQKYPKWQNLRRFVICGFFFHASIFKAFEMMDTNKDGKGSEEEMKAYFLATQRERDGRTLGKETYDGRNRVYSHNGISIDAAEGVVPLKVRDTAFPPELYGMYFDYNENASVGPNSDRATEEAAFNNNLRGVVRFPRRDGAKKGFRFYPPTRTYSEAQIRHGAFGPDIYDYSYQPTYPYDFIDFTFVERRTEMKIFDAAENTQNVTDQQGVPMDTLMELFRADGAIAQENTTELVTIFRDDPLSLLHILSMNASLKEHCTPFRLWPSAVVPIFPNLPIPFQAALRQAKLESESHGSEPLMKIIDSDDDATDDADDANTVMVSNTTHVRDGVSSRLSPTSDDEDNDCPLQVIQKALSNGFLSVPTFFLHGSDKQFLTPYYFYLVWDALFVSRPLEESVKSVNLRAESLLEIITEQQQQQHPDDPDYVTDDYGTVTVTVPDTGEQIPYNVFYDLPNLLSPRKRYEMPHRLFLPRFNETFYAETAPKTSNNKAKANSSTAELGPSSSSSQKETEEEEKEESSPRSAATNVLIFVTLALGTVLCNAGLCYIGALIAKRRGVGPLANTTNMGEDGRGQPASGGGSSNANNAVIIRTTPLDPSSSHATTTAAADAEGCGMMKKKEDIESRNRDGGNGRRVQFVGPKGGDGAVTNKEENDSVIGAKGSQCSINTCMPCPPTGVVMVAHRHDSRHGHGNGTTHRRCTNPMAGPPAASTPPLHQTYICEKGDGDHPMTTHTTTTTSTVHRQSSSSSSFYSSVVDVLTTTTSEHDAHHAPSDSDNSGDIRCGEGGSEPARGERAQLNLSPLRLSASSLCLSPPPPPPRHSPDDNDRHVVTVSAGERENERKQNGLRGDSGGGGGDSSLLFRLPSSFEETDNNKVAIKLPNNQQQHQRHQHHNHIRRHRRYSRASSRHSSIGAIPPSSVPSVFAVSELSSTEDPSTISSTNPSTSDQQEPNHHDHTTSSSTFPPSSSSTSTSTSSSSTSTSSSGGGGGKTSVRPGVTAVPVVGTGLHQHQHQHQHKTTPTATTDHHQHHLVVRLGGGGRGENNNEDEEAEDHYCVVVDDDECDGGDGWAWIRSVRDPGLWLTRCHESDGTIDGNNNRTGTDSSRNRIALVPLSQRHEVHSRWCVRTEEEEEEEEEEEIR